MDPITAALQAVAGALHGWSLDGTGGNLVAASVGEQDGAAIPCASVKMTEARWRDTGRPGSAYVLTAETTFAFPNPTGPVVSAMQHAAASGLRARLGAAGRTLGDTALAWSLGTARLQDVTVGGRSQPGLVADMQIWMKEA